MHAPFDLSGKVALVTGGNGGIGLGFARGLARAGGSLSIWGTNPQKNAAAVRELESMGTEVLGVLCDVGNEEEVERAFARTVGRFGKVDAVFANSGVPQRGTRFADITLDEWRAVFRVNIDGAFMTLRAAIRHMLERGGGGSLIVTSSVAASFGMPRGEHYAATKAGLVAVVRSLAVEYGKHGIRANAVLPGWTKTSMNEEYFGSDSFRKAVLPRIPVGRWGTPDDFSGLAVYLASDASAYHTGDVITIDGGYGCF